MEDEIKVHVIEYADRSALVLRYRDPNSGRFKTRSAKTTIRREAEKAAAVWESELRSGRYASPSKTTWLDFRERYENEVCPGLSSATVHKIDTTLDMVERILSPVKVRDITSARLSWLVAELRKETKITVSRKVKTGRKVETKSIEITKPGLSDNTIQGYMAHLKAAFRWAERTGIIVTAPRFPKPQRAAGSDSAKGRAISGEEFDRMLAAVPKIVGEARATEWARYLRGLWLSGFRIGESLRLSWDEGAGIVVDITGRNPVAHITAAAQKSHRTETIPLAPEFGEFLAETPVEDRSGPVFRLIDGRGLPASLESAIRTVSDIGRRANVKTWTNPKSGETKCATAHDLRRSFGTRWASLVMPAVLQQMMRHSSIQTTMAFYVTRNAVTAGDVIREAVEKARQGNILGNTAPAERHGAATKKDANPDAATR